VLSLFDEQRGSVALPRAWTDQAAPSPYAALSEPPPILEVRCLLQLWQLKQILEKKVDHVR
jgi:hypothetical protein